METDPQRKEKPNELWKSIYFLISVYIVLYYWDLVFLHLGSGFSL